ncbi:MAG TPA: protein phosphatase 2C domain-containing protein [Marmoricola sp.]|nr:protein phosphatase 2C domain-containing protein [Marmoricola sp.]
MAPPTGGALQLRFAAVSDVGRVRKDNQDSGYAGPHLLVIADGVGGAARGDVASSAAVEELKRLDRAPSDVGDDALGALAGAVHRAHDRLREIVRDHPDLDGTSTTISAGIFDGHDLGVVHVGDSRGYLLRGGRLEPLTTDHTLVQSLIEEGRITQEEARVHPHRNLILRAVDGVHEPEPDAHTVTLQDGDRLLFCSDGCSGVLDDDAMADILGAGELEAAAAELVRSALEAGSSDNVTVVLAEAVAADGAPAAAAQVVGAAATQPHLNIVDDRTGSLDAEEVAAFGGTGAEEDDEDYDPEELRYAPRPPRRMLWLRRIVVLVVVLALIALGANYLYGLSQKQYYVSSSADRVAIFRGVQADLPGLTLHRVYEETDIELSDLPTSYQRRVRSGISAESLPAARRVVENLRTFAVCGDEAPTPKPSPTKKPTRKSSPTATGTASPRPRATASLKATGTKRATRSPSASPSPTPSAPSADCGEAP